MLSEQNIEAELSYAYLHAIAARGGFGCFVAPRHLDDASVDAQVHEDGRLLDPGSIYTSFGLHVQLKATRVLPTEQEERYSLNLPIHQYNRLREVRIGIRRILVVLYLPQDPKDWLHHSEESLIARRCAYWVSLRGAPASQNETSQTVYIPRAQPLSVRSLTEIMTRCSKEEDLFYVS